MKLIKILLDVTSRLLFGLVIVGVIFAIDWVYTAINTASGAPQQAAGAAIGLAFAIIPYCLARAFEKIVKGI